MSAREEILGRLRAALRNGAPFSEVETTTQLPVTRIAPDEDLKARFVAEAERVRARVHCVPSASAALETLRTLLTSRAVQRAVMWDEQHLPISGVAALLDSLGIMRVEGDNQRVAAAEVGITGADAALATTGTLVLSSGRGRPRMASLLVPVHIALITEDRILPRLEDYIAAQRAQGLRVFRTSSNVTLISGSSRTSDIEMHPVFGVHGPLELHVVLIENLARE